METNQGYYLDIDTGELLATAQHTLPPNFLSGQDQLNTDLSVGDMNQHFDHTGMSEMLAEDAMEQMFIDNIIQGRHNSERIPSFDDQGRPVPNSHRNNSKNRAQQQGQNPKNDLNVSRKRSQNVSNGPQLMACYKGAHAAQMNKHALVYLNGHNSVVVGANQNIKAGDVFHQNKKLKKRNAGNSQANKSIKNSEQNLQLPPIPSGGPKNISQQKYVTSPQNNVNGDPVHHQTALSKSQSIQYDTSPRAQDPLMTRVQQSPLQPKGNFRARRQRSQISSTSPANDDGYSSPVHPDAPASNHWSEKRGKARSGAGGEGPSYIFQKQSGTDPIARSPASAMKSQDGGHAGGDPRNNIKINYDGADLQTNDLAGNNGKYVIINDKDELVDLNDANYINEEDQKDTNKKRNNDLMKKNLERLEALKNKKANEAREMEEQRERMKRRQDRLKNMILKEAQDNRVKKQQEEQKRQEENEANAQVEQETSPAQQEPLEPDEEERQKKMQMMKKYYRNRHATFIKALLGQKKKENEDKENQKHKEERRKQKVKEKALASLNQQGIDATDPVGAKPREGALPMIDQVSQQELEEYQTHFNPNTQNRNFNRGNSTAAIGSNYLGNRQMRGSSLSARQDWLKGGQRAKNAAPDASNSTTNTTHLTQGSGMGPGTSKQQQMVAAYGVKDEQIKNSRGSKRGLKRQSSRQSARSSHSVRTPLVSRKDRFTIDGQMDQGLSQVNLMPSLKKQNDVVQLARDAVIYDEEQEQAQLEEARKRKERAKRMREQQARMLADIKAKKDQKEKQEQEQKLKYEKTLAKAREQVKQNFQDIPVKPPEQESQPDQSAQKKPKKFVDDKHCLQAPDNDGGEVSPSKKEKKPFIEPNLKAFMERNIPKLQVFLNITDMKTWKKKHQLDDAVKVFIVTGGYGYLKKSLRKRGWVENKDPNSPCFDLKWTLKSKDIDHNQLND